VEGLLKTRGKLPVNVKFLIEGEEETGGEHIESYVGTKPARLKSDAAIICDTEMFAPELPTICIGLRGMVYAELHVEGANHDLHSGVYGGAAPNPMQAVAEIISALKDRDGHIRFQASTTAWSRPAPKSVKPGPACPSTSATTRKRRWARASW
jgi:acetylornithine deacetylase/succinyl-diaminopimelate desuccinylase-like protein